MSILDINLKDITDTTIELPKSTDIQANISQLLFDFLYLSLMKLEQARSSFILLTQNTPPHDWDATIVAGGILENLAVFYSIQVYPDLADQSFEEYYFVSMIQEIDNRIEAGSDINQIKSIINLFNCVVKSFDEKRRDQIITNCSKPKDNKKPKDKKDALEYFNKLINATTESEVSTAIKRFNKPSPNKYVKNLISLISNSESDDITKRRVKDVFTDFYQTYCKVKHNSIFAFDLLDTNNQNATWSAEMLKKPAPIVAILFKYFKDKKYPLIRPSEKTATITAIHNGKEFVPIAPIQCHDFAKHNADLKKTTIKE